MTVSLRETQPQTSSTGSHSSPLPTSHGRRGPQNEQGHKHRQLPVRNDKGKLTLKTSATVSYSDGPTLVCLPRPRSHLSPHAGPPPSTRISPVDGDTSSPRALHRYPHGRPDSLETTPPTPHPRTQDLCAGTTTGRRRTTPHPRTQDLCVGTTTGRRRTDSRAQGTGVQGGPKEDGARQTQKVVVPHTLLEPPPGDVGPLGAPSRPRPSRVLPRPRRTRRQKARTMMSRRLRGSGSRPVQKHGTVKGRRGSGCRARYGVGVGPTLSREWSGEDHWSVTDCRGGGSGGGTHPVGGKG